VTIVVDAEPGIDPLEAEEAVDEQPGSDEQHERERNLGDDEYRARPRATAAAGRPAIACLVEDGRRVGPRALPRRDEPEHERAAERDERRDA
jgi:hypothetical protein